MNETFLENNYCEFLEFKELKSEVQTTISEFCSFYLENYKGTDKDKLESLKLFFTKFLKDTKKDSIFLNVFNNSLKICVYDSNINFIKINESLVALKEFINEFKEFLND